MKKLILSVVIVASTNACATMQLAVSAGYVLVSNNTQQDCVLFRNGEEVGPLQSGKDARIHFWSGRQNMLLSCKVFKSGKLAGFTENEFYARRSGRYGYRNQSWSIRGFSGRLR
ncbi:MAG: hypothetical protein V4690_02705 [Patescibacteria group bacterium]